MSLLVRVMRLEKAVLQAGTPVQVVFQSANEPDLESVARENCCKTDDKTALIVVKFVKPK